MRLALQCWLRSFINLPSSAVGLRRNLKGSGTLVCFRVRAMGSKRQLSNSRVPVSSEDKKDKKLKGLMGTNPNSAKGVVEEYGVRSSSVEIERFKDDPARIEAMTVQELRTALSMFPLWRMIRERGVPAKGCKRDLVYALKCFVDKKMDGENSLVVEEQVSSISAENISVKTKVMNLSNQDSVEDVNTDLVVPGLPQHKGRLPIRSDEVPGGKVSRAKRKVSSNIVTEVVNAHEGLNTPIIQTEPWTVLAHKKPQKEGSSAFQLSQREDFDVLCLQETKLQEKDVENIKQCLMDGYENSFWTCSVSKLGYSGTAIISRIKPLSVRYGLGISDHDSEDGLKRLSYRVTQWDPALSNYMKELEKSKPVILTGDLNCAHEEIDIYTLLNWVRLVQVIRGSGEITKFSTLSCNKKFGLGDYESNSADNLISLGNKRSAGFTDEERQSFGTNFLSRGFVDTFRRQHPGVVGYTYWGYRHGGRKTNRGWRLDYFLVSESIADKVYDSYILADVGGSDHCPIGLIFKL
ncbi:hypothetical protein SLA2020_430600 [Shorea laevis]